jgi:hypothetical protein
VADSRVEQSPEGGGRFDGQPTMGVVESRRGA